MTSGHGKAVVRSSGEGGARRRSAMETAIETLATALRNGVGWLAESGVLVRDLRRHLGHVRSGARLEPGQHRPGMGHDSRPAAAGAGRGVGGAPACHDRALGLGDELAAQCRQRSRGRSSRAGARPRTAWSGIRAAPLASRRSIGVRTVAGAARHRLENLCPAGTLSARLSSHRPLPDGFERGQRSSSALLGNSSSGHGLHDQIRERRLGPPVRRRR